MSELTCLELSVVLWVVHVLVQAGVGNLDLPSGYLFTLARQQPAAARGLAVRPSDAGAGELCREPYGRSSLSRSGAHRHPAHWRLGALGATIWILARIVYFPIYLLGVIYVRTAVWAISIIGLLMMLSRLIGW